MNPPRTAVYRSFSELLLPHRGYDENEALDLLGLDLDRPLEEEHLKVFGHGAARQWPPYETEYGTAHLFQQTEEMADIAGFYTAWGLKPEGERLDHAAVELEFMAFLADKEERARTDEQREIARDAQRKFLSDHLARWLPAFATRLEEGIPSTFYAGLARALRTFIEDECSKIGAAPAALRPLDLRTGEPPSEMECGGCDFGVPR